MGPVATSNRRVQIDAWGCSYTAVRDIQERIAQVLEAFTGPLPNSDYTFVSLASTTAALGGLDRSAAGSAGEISASTTPATS